MFELLIFIYLVLTFMAFSFVEVANYKDFGSKKRNRKIWEKQSQAYSQYHKALWYLFFPLVVMMPAFTFFLLTKQAYQTFKLLFLCFSAYCIGGTLEDRFFFILAKMKFCPKTVFWFKKWFKILWFEVPTFYVYSILTGIVLLAIYFIL